MANRFKFFSKAFNPSINNYISGFVDENIKSRLSGDDDLIFTIPIRFQYRPDLISTHFWGSPSLYWVLVYVNGISDSPEGFKTGKKIKIPSFERIVGVI